jgi:hypothetical protein
VEKRFRSNFSFPDVIYRVYEKKTQNLRFLLPQMLLFFPFAHKKYHHFPEKNRKVSENERERENPDINRSLANVDRKRSVNEIPFPNRFLWFLFP